MLKFWKKAKPEPEAESTEAKEAAPAENTPKHAEKTLPKDERVPMISIKGLHKAYGPKQVLKGLDLDVYEGELFGFIGKNGIGKSTTIDCVIGSKKFDAGEITLNGFEDRKSVV